MVAMATALQVSFCFFCDVHFLPSLKNTALIFRDIFSIEYCAVTVEPPMTSSLSSFAKYKNVNISKTKKDFPKRKMPLFFTLKSLSNKQQLFLTS